MEVAEFPHDVRQAKLLERRDTCGYNSECGVYASSLNDGVAAKPGNPLYFIPEVQLEVLFQYLSLRRAEDFIDKSLCQFRSYRFGL
jgi:hypothetical protein